MYPWLQLNIYVVLLVLQLHTVAFNTCPSSFFILKTNLLDVTWTQHLTLPNLYITAPIPGKSISHLLFCYPITLGFNPLNPHLSKWFAYFFYVFSYTAWLIMDSCFITFTGDSTVGNPQILYWFLSTCQWCVFDSNNNHFLWRCGPRGWRPRVMGYQRVGERCYLHGMNNTD